MARRTFSSLLELPAWIAGSIANAPKGGSGSRRMACLATLVGAMLFSTSSHAIPIVFSGYDVGTESLATSPLATAAAAAFDAAAGPLSVIDFESGLPPGVTMSSPDITSDSGCGAVLCGYNTTLGGSLFHLQLTGLQTFSFATPIDSFGAFFTGWQIGTQTITYTDTSTVELAMPGVGNGGTVFFGFVDAGASISSITYNAINDFVSIDDLRFGAVPEPGTLVLLGLGLVAMGSTRRRSRRPTG